MKITPIASSSSGNCHIIESGNRKLILDCGVSLKKMRQSLNYDFSKIDACLITHQHSDHCKGSRDLSKTGLRIFATLETIKQNNLLNSVALTPETMFKISDVFSAYTIPLQHDCECFGFLIYSHAEKTNLLYISDTGRLPGPVPGLRYLMIEANHDFEIMLEIISNLSGKKKKDYEAKCNRTAKTHLDIKQVCDFVRKHPGLEEVHLIHLSDWHSNESEFKRMVQGVCGCPVLVAAKN